MERNPEVWQKISEGATRARTSATKKKQAIDRCFEIGGERSVRHHFSHFLDAAEHTWSKVRRLAMKEADIQVAVARIRDTVYLRLPHPRPGRSSPFYPVAAALAKA